MIFFNEFFFNKKQKGFVGNGSYCNEPPKLETGFLIVSQGVAAVKFPLSGSRRGVPVSAAMMYIKKF